MSWQDLKDFENDYEIWTEFPYQIRKKSNQRIVKESIHKSTGYIRCCLKRESKSKHVLVARQFIPNPNNYPCVDHLNNIKTDYRVENLRWCTVRMNNNNRFNQTIVNEISDEAIPVKKYGEHEFDFLFFDPTTDEFYYYNGLNYNLKPRFRKKTFGWYVSFPNKNGKYIQIFFNVFKEEYGLI